MDRRNPWTIASAVVLVTLGVLWGVSNVTDVDIPLEWLLPSLLVLAGVLMLVGSNNGNGPRDKRPPSQFERDDAPRVP
ncbi:MAG: hypothetical protein JWL76_838 [Thermoleophilia bacterium]|nr:hypothetical protein [Thermoleophilia bacterium]